MYSFGHQAVLTEAPTFRTETDRLIRAACPTEDARATGTGHIAASQADGMTWVEDLRYAAEQRGSPVRPALRSSSDARQRNAFTTILLLEALLGICDRLLDVSKSIDVWQACSFIRRYLEAFLAKRCLEEPLLYFSG